MAPVQDLPKTGGLPFIRNISYSIRHINSKGLANLWESAAAACSSDYIKVSKRPGSKIQVVLPQIEGP